MNLHCDAINFLFISMILFHYVQILVFIQKNLLRDLLLLFGFWGQYHFLDQVDSEFGVFLPQLFEY